MRTYQQTVRVGEYLGPIDWSYDFSQHDWGPSKGGMNPSVSESRVAVLREIEKGGEWEATTDGGFPRVGWGRVLEIGMYDGWPHWRPVPSVCLSGPLGAEWHPFYSITEARQLE